MDEGAILNTELAVPGAVYFGMPFQHKLNNETTETLNQTDDFSFPKGFGNDGA